MGAGCCNKTRQIDMPRGKLWEIFNAALSSDHFLDGFKQAKMRMIPKLHIHLETGNHLHAAQYGFRSGRGTVHAITLATETMAVHQANRSCCNLVLQDNRQPFRKLTDPAGTPHKP
ncbi:hypothetical protein E2C01_014732 [Portunus trituberculatus]|uniref:Reverse transcriptase domain-containing protein n=1 Tax=Portunus trituberculatus TaxID=210409 RepID=A0A5B7DKW0_PORTR|nr:hypothetical protein [Portunus trituberculatus]